MKCHGVALVCRLQLDASPDTHECAQAGKCIFTPVTACGHEPVPKTHCRDCPEKPDAYCVHDCTGLPTIKQSLTDGVQGERNG